MSPKNKALAVSAMKTIGIIAATAIVTIFLVGIYESEARFNEIRRQVEEKESRKQELSRIEENAMADEHGRMRARVLYK